MINKKTITFAVLAATVPFFALATGDVNTGLATLGKWIGTLGQLIIAATVVAFFWGVFQFVFNSEKREEGKDMMLWGIIGLFVMVSLWGIIGFLQKSTVGSDNKALDSLNTIVPIIK